MVKAGWRFNTLDLDLPSVAIPNISLSVLTSEKFREHHILLKKCPVPDEACSILLIFIVNCCFTLHGNKCILYTSQISYVNMVADMITCVIMIKKKLNEFLFTQLVASSHDYCQFNKIKIKLYILYRYVCI